MTLKELIRSAINGEMADISGCEADAEAFASSEEAAAFFSRLAAEKRGRLKRLGSILKEGTGFRPRGDEPSRSIEAALRAHAKRAGEASGVYAALVKVIKKPEFKEELKVLAVRELETQKAIKKIQAGLKS
jgi:rubrerythrin